MTQSVQPYQCAHSSAAPTLHFCPLEAAAIGLREAIVVARLRFWLGRSKHIFGGRPWVYNMYAEWQRQFPFWSVFTVKNLFRRLERLGVIESTQRFNTSRWNRRKWYTLNAEALAELVGSGGVPNAADASAEAASSEAVGMDAAAPMDGQPAAVIDEREPPPIDGADFVPCLESGSSSRKIPKRECARELDGGARTHPLEDAEPEVTRCHLGGKPVNELDAAYEAIPETERETWLQRAERALEAARMPGWMRIAPTVKEMALRLWVGTTIPALVSG